MGCPKIASASLSVQELKIDFYLGKMPPFIHGLDLFVGIIFVKALV